VIGTRCPSDKAIHRSSEKQRKSPAQVGDKELEIFLYLRRTVARQPRL